MQPAAERPFLAVPLRPGLAALERRRRRGRPDGPARVSGDRLLLPLPMGSAEDVPELLRWLGWSHLAAELRAEPQTADPGDPSELTDAQPWPGAELPGLLDELAAACARDRLLSCGLPCTPGGSRWGSDPGR